MRLQRIAPFTVKTKALARRDANRVKFHNDFSQPIKLTEKARALVGQVDQQIMMLTSVLAKATDDFGVGLIRGAGVRYKGVGAKAPEQLIQSLRLFLTGAMQIHLMAFAPGFVRQTASIGQAGIGLVAIEQIEVNAGHK
jgi:hypothetical protein